MVGFLRVSLSSERRRPPIATEFLGLFQNQQVSWMSILGQGRWILQLRVCHRATTWPHPRDFQNQGHMVPGTSYIWHHLAHPKCSTLRWCLTMSKSHNFLVTDLVPKAFSVDLDVLYILPICLLLLSCSIYHFLWHFSRKYHDSDHFSELCFKVQLVLSWFA